MTKAQEAITSFAQRYCLIAEEVDVDGKFFAARKQGADPSFHGWILAEADDGRIIYCPHADDFDHGGWLLPEDTGSDGRYTEGWGERIKLRKRARIAQAGFSEEEVELWSEDLIMTLDAFNRMVSTGIDPFGKRIEDAIASWAPQA